MRFADPLFLLLALPALAALWLRLARPRWFRPAMTFSTAGEARRLPASLSGRLFKHLDSALAAAALVLAAAALARPQRDVLLGVEPAEGLDIVLAIDTSGSMKAVDFENMNRLVAAKKHADAFIRGRRNDRIGIVAFGGYAFLQCPLTLDYQALLEFLRLVEIEMTGEEGTAIGEAIATSVNHLQDSRAESRIVILLTDGRNNAGAVDPITAAKAAAVLGIKVYAIGTGARGASLFPMEDPVYGTRWVQIREDLDEPTLQEVAHRTGGRYFRATTVPEMREIFEEIDRLERSKVETPPAAAHHDLYPLFLVPSAALLLASILAGRLWVVRIP